MTTKLNCGLLPYVRCSLSGRYATSLYYAFNALEHAYSDQEKVVAVVCELVLALIYGMLAGLMSSVMIAMGAGEQEKQKKMQVSALDSQCAATFRGVGAKDTRRRCTLAGLVPETDASSFMPPPQRLRLWLVGRRVPSEFQHQVMAYFHKIWDQGQGADGRCAGLDRNARCLLASIQAPTQVPKSALHPSAASSRR